MELIERAIFLAIGGGIGFILGYIVARLRDIKEEVDEVLDIEQERAGMPRRRERDSEGTVTMRVVNAVALVLVVSLTAFASFSSQRATNGVEASKQRLEAVVVCNQSILSDTVAPLNARTEFSTERARANVSLQKAQSEFLSILLVKPPATAEAREAALNDYFDRLTRYVMVSSQTIDRAENNPYATVEQLDSCLDRIEGAQNG